MGKMMLVAVVVFGMAGCEPDVADRTVTACALTCLAGGGKVLRVKRSICECQPANCDCRRDAAPDAGQDDAGQGSAP